MCNTQYLVQYSNVPPRAPLMETVGAFFRTRLIELIVSFGLVCQQMSWNVKFYEMSNFMKCQMSNVMKLQMPWMVWRPKTMFAFQLFIQWCLWKPFRLRRSAYIDLYLPIWACIALKLFPRYDHIAWGYHICLTIIYPWVCWFC